MRTSTPIVLAVLALGMAAACRQREAATVDTTPAAAPAPPPTPSVSAIELGRQIGANRRVTDTTSAFARRDTIYLVVVTENAPMGANLMAKWTFVETGQQVDSTTQPVAPAEPGSPTSVTEFHISKPSGWPTGKYRVEVWLDGASQGTREFEVKR
jgi:hypothetical protein